MIKLATIGYEQSSLEDFIATLRAAKIKTIVDVREFPISRRKGFSKNALRDALEYVSLEYIHLIGLGDPKEGREAARKGRKTEFLKIYRTHLKSPAAKADLILAAEIVKNGGACLLCYERDPSQCHRVLVAEALSAIIEISINNLGVREGISRHGYRSEKRRSLRSSQSLPATP